MNLFVKVFATQTTRTCSHVHVHTCSTHRWVYSSACHCKYSQVHVLYLLFLARGRVSARVWSPHTVSAWPWASHTLQSGSHCKKASSVVIITEIKSTCSTIVYAAYYTTCTCTSTCSAWVHRFFKNLFLNVEYPCLTKILHKDCVCSVLLRNKIL